MPKTLPVHEMFFTFQGEGTFMGVPAFFIRLFGCPVQCPWCDSAGTWHPKWVPNHVRRMTIAEIVREADNSPANMIVITGGEPAIHNLSELTAALHGINKEICLETSGAFEIRGDFNWITVSPKRWKLPLKSSVERANEFKLIIESPGDILFYLDLLRSKGLDHHARSVWLHPEWSHRADPVVLASIVGAVKSVGLFGFLRAGWQIHKLYSADSFDNRSQPLVQ